MKCKHLTKRDVVCDRAVAAATIAEQRLQAKNGTVPAAAAEIHAPKIKGLVIFSVLSPETAAVVSLPSPICKRHTTKTWLHDTATLGCAWRMVVAISLNHALRTFFQT